MSKVAVDTRKLYYFEDHILSAFPHMNKQHSLKFLQDQAVLIWKATGSKYKIPNIRFGPGVMYGGRPLSYCEGRSNIELCPGQRDLLTLIHELTHAAGPVNHGKNFVDLHFNLLKKFARADKNLLDTF